MAARFFAVLDTNVLASAMFTGNPSSNPRKILDMALGGTITPLLNKEMSSMKSPYQKKGLSLVTGNTKHFPKEPIVVTPAEMLEIIKNSQE